VASFALTGLLGCGQAGESGAAAQTSSDGEDATSVAAAEIGRQPSLKDLGPSGRRVMVLVLPGDASVEVDGAAVRRRDGVIELVGRVGDKRRLRVLKGAQSREQEVTLLEASAEPALIDMNAPLGKGGAGPVATASSDASPAVKTPGNPLFSDKFDE
jgi:hypothetical protein